MILRTSNDQPLWRAMLLTAAAVVAASSPLAAAQDAVGTWELRVCAPPLALPFSNMEREGFENRIADIIAEEVGAHVTYEWVDFTEDLYNLFFAEGLCDVILGIPDGFGRGMNTLSYYSSPYVIAYLADSGIDIESLDDPDLKELRIGVHGAGTPPHTALLYRGLLQNVTRLYGGSAGSEDRLGVMIEALEAGEIDVGFGWGPSTAYWAERAGVGIDVRPVEPQFEPPSLFQVQPMTMAVRRDDVALQTLLNWAIVARWDEVQAVLAEYGVPIVEGPPPFAGEPARPRAEVVVDVGIVLPVPTGGRTFDAAINDFTGIAALRGALLAQAAIEAEQDASDVALVFHYASSPSPESATRAAERLVLTANVDILVGGIGDGQAEALAGVAEEHGVLFLDVGSSGHDVRGGSSWNRFRLAPAPEAYVGALARATRERADGPVDWFVVHLDDADGDDLARAAVETLYEHGDRVVDGIAVVSGDPTFEGAYRRIEESGANAILVLLPTTEQLVFMGGYQDRGGEALLAAYPEDPAQTRNFLAANVEYGVALDTPRVLAWETTLADGRAGEFNRRFTSRFGQPADPTAWTTYEALRIAQRAAELARDDDPDALAAVLASGATFTTAKGALHFDDSHRLVEHSLYVVEIDPEAVWGQNLNQQVQSARLVRTLVPEPLPALP